MNSKSQQKPKNIRNMLTTATSCLLGASAAHAQNEAGWDTDVAVLIYNETDRVSAFEPAVSLKKTYDDDSVLGFKLVYDALTGASHNGAAESDQVQTFTRPSGKGSYTTAAGDVPLDDTFRDSRGSLSVSYEQPLSRMDKMIYGGNVSAEHDFVSLSGSATYLHDINQRNTTLSAGFSFEYDQITPEGGIPVALSEMQSNTNPQVRDEDSDTRTMAELLFGVTQVVDRYTLMQFNYGFSQSSGYHTDPYKIVSVLNPDGTLAFDPANGLNGTYIYENRPDSRTKHSLYAKVKRYLGGDVADISYRYMWDDWDVVSHTIDSHYRFNMDAGWYIEPHVRYYQQQAAEFYRYSISNAETVPEFISADYRLGDMTATTIGAKFGFMAGGHANSIRVEMYQQSGDNSPSDMDALILQYNYKF